MMAIIVNKLDFLVFFHFFKYLLAILIASLREFLPVCYFTVAHESGDNLYFGFNFIGRFPNQVRNNFTYR